jgi:hypothetical protein
LKRDAAALNVAIIDFVFGLHAFDILLNLPLVEIHERLAKLDIHLVIETIDASRPDRLLKVTAEEFSESPARRGVVCRPTSRRCHDQSDQHHKSSTYRKASPKMGYR